MAFVGKDVPRHIGIQLIAERIRRRLEPGSNGCLLWTGWTDIKGYGHTSFHGKNERTHRVMWELVKGQIPKDKILCHTCDMPACCNVEHLWLGTVWENGQDAKAKRRCKYQKVDACIHGHKFTPENTRLTKLGHRQCRLCQRIALRKRAGWPAHLLNLPAQPKGQRPMFHSRTPSDGVEHGK